MSKTTFNILPSVENTIEADGIKRLLNSHVIILITYSLLRGLAHILKMLSKQQR